jgi:2-methylisocitrate lyase-like PEP mutase family enzyme
MTTFLDLHRPGRPLLAPNPWDLGSAKVLAHLGFEALATTSSGLATALGVLDGAVDRETTLDHARAVAEATALPVTVDLEDGHADDPAGVAETIETARDHGLAGASIEDWDGDRFYVEAVRTPVNVLLRPAGPTVAELAEAGVARITVGGAFAFAALGTLVEMAQQLLDEGTVGDGRLSGVGMRAAKAALSR